MPDAIIPSELTNDALKILLKMNIVDRSLKIERTNTHTMIPLLIPDIPEEIVRKYRIKFDHAEHRKRSQRKKPFESIRESLLEIGLDRNLLSRFPDKWEMVGDVLIIKLSEDLMGFSQPIAEQYAKILGAKTVLRDLEKIAGQERLPEVQLLIGDETETIHIENGVKYCLDVARIMFSSGNIDERIRMASIDFDGKSVLDMFAGIGYFTLPIAVHQKPKMIFSCEIRQLTYDFLLKNIDLNAVREKVIPFFGDNRSFNPPEKVDAIIMGYLKDTKDYLPKALSCLKSGGTIFYHENCPNVLFPGRIIDNLKSAAGDKWTVEILSKRIVKSFSPGVSHVVIDARFNEI
ncbi:MAG: class I SAM-dependent methyltransferase family protein [Thermoplasmata archaeon]|nr:class I SAM-dependent methyltransferase family protein [Thermoplasmata archaeon]